MQFDQLKRRNFITLLGGAAIAWPLAAGAQQGERMRRIGVLMGIANDALGRERVKAFAQGLQELGWVPGRNTQIDFVWAGGAVDIQPYAQELVRSAPDVLLATSTTTTIALRQETSTIPIVFVTVSDPIGSGFVASLSHPGGNVTGFTPAEFSGKSLEVLKEAAPHVTRVAVILNPEQKPQAGMWRAIEAAAPSFRVQLTAARVRNAAEIERAIDVFARESNGGLLVLPNPVNEGNRNLIIAMAARHRLPAVYAFRFFVTDGGLISYGVDLADQYRQAASYVDRILRGEKPAELPVQQPTKFALVINLKTAKALGLEVPPTLLARADEVIE
jgi:putative tryptophan/tyrosine transport system substrate-binding protein